MIPQLLLHALGVRARLVDLVHRDHDRNLGGASVIDRLDRLRHDSIVGRHDQDDDVGHLRAARAHGGERLVTRGVEEGHLPGVHLDRIGADVLGDTTRLAGRHVGGPDRVEQ